MNGQIISTGLKKLVLPLVSNAILKKTEPQDPIDNIDNRIKRVEKMLDKKKGEVSDISDTPINTHTSPVYSYDEDVATSCIACARSHIATVSASLKEAIRFARSEGIMHPEVQTRLATAEEEITALERYDFSPERVENSPPEEQEIVNIFLPKIRTLRQDISTIKNLPDLVKCAGEAGRLLSEYRMEVLKISIKEE